MARLVTVLVLLACLWACSVQAKNKYSSEKETKSLKDSVKTSKDETSSKDEKSSKDSKSKMPAIGSKHKDPVATKGDVVSETASKHDPEDVFLKKIREKVLQMGHLTKLIIVGDSIMSRLFREQSTWSVMEKKYAAINLASPGDTTETILHRLATPHEFSDMTTTPDIIVHVGTTNMIAGQSANDIFKGIVAVVDSVSKTFSKSKIHVFGLLPFADPKYKELSVTINTKLVAAFETGSRSNIEYIDTGVRWKEATASAIAGGRNISDTGDKCFSNGFVVVGCQKLLYACFKPTIEACETLNRPLPPPVHLGHHAVGNPSSSSPYHHAITKDFHNKTVSDPTGAYMQAVQKLQAVKLTAEELKAVSTAVGGSKAVNLKDVKTSKDLGDALSKLPKDKMVAMLPKLETELTAVMKARKTGK
jgi:hypothetical protein